MSAVDEAPIRQEIAVIGALARGLYQFLASLDEAGLTRQSACAAWTVRDVAGHLTNRAERQIASMTRARQGDASPPPGFTPPSGNRAMSAANADADIAYARGLGNDLLPAFEQQYRALHALLDSFAGAEWHRPCWHPRRGTMTAREYVSQRIQELAIHDWDIRSAFDPSAALHPDAVPVLLGMSAHWLRAAYHPGDDPPDGTKQIRFRMPAAAADLNVSITPAGAEVTPVPHRTPKEAINALAEGNLAEGNLIDIEQTDGELADVDLLVETDPNTYLLLAYGRLDISHRALYGTRLWLAGELPLLERFARWMQGF